MKPKVYVTRLIPQAGLDLLQDSCEVEVNPEDRPLTREELLAHVADKHGVIGLMTDRIDAEFFEAAKVLKGYANFAVGFDNIDVAEATRRRMPVSNTPGCSPSPPPNWPGRCFSRWPGASWQPTASCVRAPGRDGAPSSSWGWG